MRTTLNLDDDVAARLSELAKRQGRSLSRVANDTVRAGLAAMARREPLRPYEPTVFSTGRSRYDLTDISEVLGVLDDLDADG